MLEITQIPVLSDNYIYLLRDSSSGATAVVDPAVASPVLDALERRGQNLDFVLNTHHHSDHVGGNLELKRKTGCRIVGSAPDSERIPGIDIEVDEGDGFCLGASQARVFSVSGHTCGHIAYWFEGDSALFCGDTLFAMGCGRLFEGTPAQMLESLEKLRELPDATRVYCAHEYTQANGRFALTVDPLNPELQKRMRQVNRARADRLPTVPSTLAEERATNPFLRADDPEVQAVIGVGSEPLAVFTEIRARKDSFR